MNSYKVPYSDKGSVNVDTAVCVVSVSTCARARGSPDRANSEAYGGLQISAGLRN